MVVFSVVYRTGIGSGFGGCNEVPGSHSVAKTRTTTRLLELGKVASINVEVVPNGLASGCGPAAGVVSLSRTICGSGDVTTINVTYRRTKRTYRRTRKCFPLGVEGFVVPMAGFNSGLNVPLTVFNLVFGCQPLLCIKVVLCSTITLFRLLALPIRLGTSGHTLGAVSRGKFLVNTRCGNTGGILATTTLACITTLTSSLTALLELVLVSRHEQ